MAEEVGGVVYKFDADVKGFERGVAKIKSDFSEVRKDADRVAKQTEMAMRNLGSSLTASLGAGDLTKISQRWSKMTGLLASDMDKVAAAAKADGISFAQATQRLIYFNGESGRAARGSGELYKALVKHDAEAANMIRLTTNVTQRQAILNGVLDRTTDASAKAAIHAAAFGTAMGQADAKAAGLAGSIGGMGKAMTAVLTVAAVQQMGQALIGALRSVADIGDLAANIGMTTDQLQSLQYAFGQAGITAEESAGGLNRFADKLSDARRGEGEFYDIVNANNIALTDREGNIRANYDVMLDFSDAISKTRNAEDQLAMAIAIFGKNAGPQFIEALREGKSGLEAMAEAARNSGGIISSEMIASADRLEKRWNAWFQWFEAKAQLTAVTIADMLAAAVTPENTQQILDARERLLKGGTRFGKGVPVPAPTDPGQQALTPAPVSSGGKGALPDTIDLGSGGTLKKTDRTAKTSDVQSYIDSLNDEAKALQLEIDMQGKSNAEKARAQALAGLSADATAAEREAALKAADAIAAKTNALDYERTSQGLLADATQQATEKAQAQIEAQREMADFLNNELQSSFFDVIHGTESVSEAFSSMAQRMVDAMLQATLFGQGPFARMMGGDGQGSGGLISGLINGAFGTAKTPSLYAAGGSASGPIIVGEEGPELLNVPGGSSITPNEQVRQMMAGAQRGAMSKVQPVNVMPVTNVRVINNGSSQVSSKQTPNGQGGTDIEMLIEDKVIETMGSGRAARVMGGRFGARIQPRRI